MKYYGHIDNFYPW